MEETNKNMGLILEEAKFGKYNWNFCGDLKVNAVSLGIKKSLFLCEWDSRIRIY
jgi:hypothetical protein